MNDDMHCMWPSVECKQGLVVGLDLTKVGGISGYTIPNEIGILTNLKELELYDTGLIGSIPTEVGLLTKLLSLSLGKQFVLIILSLCFAIKQIIYLLLTISLWFFLIIIVIDYNAITGSIPTEIGLLSDFIELHLGKRLFLFY